MKAKMLFSLVLLATLGMTSCKKDKEEEPTTVKIGNKDYGIVKIGTQSWTAENYTGEGGLYYDNNATNAPFGKLYTIAEARAIAVPQGWRLPTLDDYKKLVESQGVQFDDNQSTENSAASIKKLMAAAGWLGQQGTNTSGFNAVPAGEGYGDDDFHSKGEQTVFWTASKTTDNDPYYIGIYNDGDAPYVFYSADASYRFSLRFVKDN